MNNKKKVFISFDFDHDQFLRDAMVGQSRLQESPFEIEDWSVKEPWIESIWKQRCLEKIRRTDMVFVMVGQYTWNCPGVLAEIKMAKDENIPIIAIEGYKDRVCICPEGVDGYYKWTWKNIDVLLEGGR